jgi:hypothetical protein
MVKIDALCRLEISHTNLLKFNNCHVCHKHLTDYCKSASYTEAKYSENFIIFIKIFAEIFKK